MKKNISKPLQHAADGVKAQKLLQQGFALHQQGQLSEAQRFYIKVLKLNPLNFDALNMRGALEEQLGNAEAAVEWISRAIAINPNHASCYNNRGNALLKLHQIDDALADFNQAIHLAPGDVQAYISRGNALLELQQVGAALASFDQAIQHKPDHAQAYNNRGNALLQLKQAAAALASYDQAIQLKPDYAIAYCNRGNALLELKQTAAAVASFDLAIQHTPSLADAYFNRGTALLELKQSAAAVASLDQAIQLQPDHTGAYLIRGNALLELQQPAAALASYDQAIQHKPDLANAHYNRGNALMHLKRLPAAISSYDQAIQLAPSHAKAYNNRGYALLELKQIATAMASYEQAIQLKPDFADAHWNKSIGLLLCGEMAEGFALYEWRWKCESPRFPNPNNAQPLWVGEESLANKTILLHSEQGLGDTLQFCRYAAKVKARGARVVLGVPKTLMPLMQSLEGVDEVVDINHALPAFDYHCPLLSLPLAFKTELATIPNADPYLRSDPIKVQHWQGKLGAKTMPRIGLVWSGSTIHRRDRDRSMSLDIFLDCLPDRLEYFCLQTEVRDADQAPLQRSTIRNFGTEITDFSDTAALCELMDAVISVDTSVVHLSAAMGKPTWVLLPYVPDWRWLLDRRDSPWYSTARLYRQDARCDWATVWNEVASDLRAVGLTGDSN